MKRDSQIGQSVAGQNQEPRGVSDFTQRSSSENVPSGAGEKQDVGATRAANYRTEAAARRAARGALPKAEMPVGGGPLPPMPFLAGSPAEGPPRPMAQHAVEQRQPPVGSVMPVGGRGIIDQGSVVNFQGPAAPAQQLDIRPTDMLPETAMRDPAFRSGPGALVAAAQPDLAAKYGVIRKGQVIPPQKLMLQAPGQRRLSPETLGGLAAITAASNAQAAHAPTAPEVPIPRRETASSDEERVDTTQSLKAEFSVDSFQINKFKEDAEVSKSATKQQRALIEARLKPISIVDMVTKGYVEQLIQVIPGTFHIVLRDYDGTTDLAMKRLVMQETSVVNADERYFLDKYTYFGITCMLHAVNDKVFPPIHDQQGNFSDDLFLARFNQVMKLPTFMLKAIMTQAYWFEERVRDLFTLDSKENTLGNG